MEGHPAQPWGGRQLEMAMEGSKARVTWADKSGGRGRLIRTRDTKQQGAFRKLLVFQDSQGEG